MENKAAKYGLWGALLAAIISGGIALYIHYDGKSNKEALEKKEIEEHIKNGTTQVKVVELKMPSINTKLDSSFLLGIENANLNDANEVNININFGEASVSACETVPENYLSLDEKHGNSVIDFIVEKLEKNEKIYVYCLISNPLFKAIKITGSNINGKEEVSFKEYKESISEESLGISEFFKFVFGIVFIVIVGYILLVLMAVINRKLNLNF